jgi:glutathione S-transferase
MYRLHGFFTQNSLKPLYVLEALEVEYEFEFVNLATGDNRSDAFRAMNPVGRVPVLEHNGRYLFESGAICRYVASEEKSPLFPADKMERAQVDQWMTYFTCHPGRWLTTIFFERVIKPKANLGDTDEARCDEAARFLHEQLGVLEGWFSTHSWLANDAFSIADVFALAYVEQTGPIGFSLQDYPRVQNWFERLEALDSTRRVRARIEPFVKMFFG